MKIEEIFRKIPGFKRIDLDTILFESKYPILFTCKNDEEIYLFICYFVDSEKIKWIGTKTTYENLINLLENKITIRNAFLNETNIKIMIEYNGNEVKYKFENVDKIPDKILPIEGEYMDSEEDEYIEEINEFKKRNKNIEYVIRPRTSKFLHLKYSTISTLDFERYIEMNFDTKNAFCYPIKKIHNKSKVLV